jgi:hypothetical protein
MGPLLHNPGQVAAGIFSHMAGRANTDRSLARHSSRQGAVGSIPAGKAWEDRMLIDPDKVVDSWCYCRQTRRLFFVREVWMWSLVDDNAIPGAMSFDGKHMSTTRAAFYFMNGRYPIEAMDHRDGDVFNNRWENLRECTMEQNRRNADMESIRRHGWRENLGQGVHKTSSGTYRVRLARMNYGSYKTAEEANAVADEIRKEVRGAFDLAMRPERNTEERVAVIIDTDKVVKDIWYCPKAGRMFRCKEIVRIQGLEMGVSYKSDRDVWRVRVERAYYGAFKTLEEANAKVHEVRDELYSDSGIIYAEAA